MRKENVVNKNKCFPGKFLSGVSRLYSRLVNQETTLCHQQRISGRSRTRAGMTPNFMSGLHLTYKQHGGFTLFPAPISRIRPYGEYRDDDIFKGVGPVFARTARTGAPLRSGFTLIELLVVVLIIGILASVALPQYQKAVEKSKATQALTMLKTVGQAMQAHHLATDNWATSFDELAVDIPWTGNEKFTNESSYSQGVSNGDWSLQFRNTQYNGNNIVSLVVGRISGAYAGAGFIIYFDEEYNLPENEILCIEFKSSSMAIPFAKEKGSYCSQIMKGKYKYGSSDFYYTLP